jgi:acetolactate synthase-1/3 small subunit
MERFIIAILVSNLAGVLTRVSSMFTRRGFNIDSLTVGETESQEFSRITIAFRGDTYIKEQLIKQLAKLHDVKEIELLDKHETVIRELLLIKVKNTSETRQDILAAVDIFRSKIVDYSTDALCCELTGESSKIEAFIELLKQDTTHFTKATELAQDRIVFKGMVGDVDGVAIIAVPKGRMPAGASFIITHPMCAPAPVKLQEYKIHQDPPGIAGHLVEGLLYHDIFVFDNKKMAIAAHFGTLGEIKVVMTAAGAGKGTVSATGTTSGGTLVYKTSASVTAAKLGDDLSAWAELPADGVVSATEGNKIVVAVRDVDGKALATSAATTVVVGA